MKKFFKLFTIIFIFALLLFSINLIRNFIILNNMQKTQSDFFSTLNNYYFIEESGTVGLFNSKKICYYKDNTYFLKTISNNKENFIWLDKNKKEFLTSDNSLNDRTYETVLNELENILAFQNFFNANSVSLGNLIYSNLFNFITVNDTVDWLNEKTYIIKLNDSKLEFYIGKDSSLIRAIKYDNSSGIGGYILNIEKDIVTLENIKKPKF